MSLRPDEQQPGEAQSHFAWFRAYLELGPSRTLIAAYRAFTRKGARKGPDRPENLPGSWKRAADKWQWRERAAQFDLDESERRLDEQRTRENKLVDRIFDGVTRSLDCAERAERVSELVLKSPLYETTIEDGKTTFVPTSWNINTGARTLLAAATSRRSAAQLLEQLDKLRARRTAREMLAAWPETGEHQTQTVAERREQQNELLDRLTAVAMSEALAGVDGAAERVLHILARAARLNGLDAPFDPISVEKPKKRRDLSHLSATTLEMLQAVCEKELDEED